MFKRLFGRKPVADDRDTAPAPDENQMKAAAMDHALEEARKTDRIVPLRVGAQELVQMLLNAMKDGRGVHVESLLVTLGSLAGFCCVDSTLKQIALMGKTSREVGIIDVGMSNGQRYYLGDPINNLLAESDHSLWALVAGAANQLGTQDYPDFADIAKHVAGTLGGV